MFVIYQANANQHHQGQIFKNDLNKLQITEIIQAVFFKFMFLYKKINI